MPPPDTEPRSHLEPSDRLHVVFGAFVVAVAVLRLHALPRPFLTVAWYGGLVLGTLLLAWGLRRLAGRAAFWPRVGWAVVVVPGSFLCLGFVVPYANPFHAERVLHAIDTWMFFGHNPNELLDRIAWPPLTELLQWAYAGYYVYPLLLVTILAAEGRRHTMHGALTAVVLCLYASYVGYFLVPSTGPNLNVLGLYPPHFTDPPQGLWMAEHIRHGLHEAEWIKHDCWPSGHTALSVVCLGIARQAGSRLAFRVLVVPVVLLVFSTMYLRYHYVIDVVCGLVLAWAVLRWAPRLETWWARRSGDGA